MATNVRATLFVSLLLFPQMIDHHRVLGCIMLHFHRDCKGLQICSSSGFYTFTCGILGLLGFHAAVEGMARVLHNLIQDNS